MINVHDHEPDCVLLAKTAEAGISYESDQVLRRTLRREDLARPAKQLLSRYHRYQGLVGVTELDVSAAYRLTAELLLVVPQGEETKKFLRFWRDTVLDEGCQFSSSQITRITKAAAAKANALSHGDEDVKAFLRNMPVLLVYEYSKLSLVERARCVADHKRGGQEPTKRSIEAFKKSSRSRPVQKSTRSNPLVTQQSADPSLHQPHIEGRIECGSTPEVGNGTRVSSNIPTSPQQVVQGCAITTQHRYQDSGLESQIQRSPSLDLGQAWFDFRRRFEQRGVLEQELLLSLRTELLWALAELEATLEENANV